MKKSIYVLLMVVFVLQIHTNVFAESLDANQDRDQIMKLYDQASMALEMGYTDDAISKLKEIIQLAPNFPETYLMLGNAYSKDQTQFESIRSALESFQKYLRLKPAAQNASEVKASIYKLEFLLEKLNKEKNLQGRWLVPDLGTNLNSDFPLFSLILDIQEIGGKMQIKMEPSSLYYSSDLVSATAYPEIDDKGNWIFYFKKNYSATYEFEMKPNPDNINEMVGVMRLLNVSATSSEQKVNKDQLVECKLIKVRNDFVNLRPEQAPKKPNPEADKIYAEGANYSTEGAKYYKEGAKYYKEGYDKRFNNSDLDFWGGIITIAGGIFGGSGVFTWIKYKDSTDPEYIDLVKGFSKPATYIGAALLPIGIPLLIIGIKENKKGDKLMREGKELQQKGKELEDKGKELQKKANGMYEPSIKSNKPTSQLKLGVSGNGLTLALTF